MRRYFLGCVVLVVVGVFGCESDRDGSTGGVADVQSGGGIGDSSGADTQTGDVSTDVAQVSLPEGCWAPAGPPATFDCPLLCKKMVACGDNDPECPELCAMMSAYLTQDAATRIEECLVDAPCGQGIAAFYFAGCIKKLEEDNTYVPPVGNDAECAKVIATYDGCGAEYEDQKGGFEFACELYALAFGAETMVRVGACSDKPCADIELCLTEATCAF